MTRTIGSVSTLYLPEPIGVQRVWLDSPASRKVIRAGRRTGKTRFSLYASLLGHGPGWQEDRPSYGGVVAGGDVVWIAQNYANLSTVLWREEIVPRLGHLPIVKLDATRHDVEICGVGSLLLRSGDRSAIDSVRGVGDRLRGVVVDEAAWLDLRGALQDVILPALMDNRGWLILVSTTNAGSDTGYDDQGAPQRPSYFNVLCQQIRAGKRGPEWQELTGTAYDNPEMDPAAVAELIGEYPDGSPKLRQEVFADLLESGLGVAFPMLDRRHWTEQIVPDGPAEWVGGFDWGYQHNWCLPFGWRDADGNIVIRDTLWGRLHEPEEIARVCRAGVRQNLTAIWSGRDTWARKGRSIGAGGLTIGIQLQASGLPFVAGVADTAASLVQGTDTVRRYLAWEKTPTLPERQPMLRFCRTEGNRRLVEQLAAMQIDPENPERVLKVDADYAGRGGDDGYEALRRLLQAYPVTPQPKKEIPADWQHRDAGIDYERKRPAEWERDGPHWRDTGVGNVPSFTVPMQYRREEGDE